MTAMLVIDTTTRALAVYTANVTRAESGLVIRQALEVGPLRLLLEGRDWQRPVETGLPVLLLGDGYQAGSSAGFVSVEEAHYGSRAAVVGMMVYDRPLRTVRPIVARLYGPGRLLVQPTHGNSNRDTASAVSQGLELLSQLDPQGVVISEGQSDYTAVYRLLPLRGSQLAHFDVGELEEEHRLERFTLESIARAAARAHARKGERIGCGREGVEYTLQLALGLEKDGGYSTRPQGGWACMGDQARAVVYATALAELDRLEAEALHAEVEQPEGSSDEALADWERELLGS